MSALNAVQPEGNSPGRQISKLDVDETLLDATIHSTIEGLSMTGVVPSSVGVTRFFQAPRPYSVILGMDDYIAKPIRLDSLKEILDRHLPVENETPSKLRRVSWCSNPLILPPERSRSFSALAALRHGLQFGLRPSPPLVKLAAEGGSDSARTKCRAPRTHSSHSWRASLARWGEILYSCAHMMKMDGQEEKGVGP